MFRRFVFVAGVSRRCSDQFHLDLVAGRQVDNLTTSLVAAHDRLATARRLALAHDGVLVAERSQMKFLQFATVGVRVMRRREAGVFVVDVVGNWWARLFDVVAVQPVMTSVYLVGIARLAQHDVVAERLRAAAAARRRFAEVDERHVDALPWRRAQ